MNRKALEILDFHEIQKLLAQETLTPMGRDLAMSAYPCTAREARARQRSVLEVHKASASAPLPSLSGAGDPRPALEKIDAGAVLSSAELSLMLRVFSVMDSVRSWLSRFDAGEYPELHSLGKKIPPVKGIVELLERTVTPEGEIKDSASDLLRKIRREIKRHLDDMRARLESLCRSPQMAPYLQEPVVNLRSGRYVLPVKQEYASRVPGVIHDQSGSGQTVFIEPLVIVEMWNELRKLELSERDEIERILREATSAIRAVPRLREAATALGELDFAFARASLMAKWRGVLPELRDGHDLVLKKARHPLLRGNPVPLDVALEQSGEAPRTLVITGPNMGGKTVALKTIGLLTALALSGFPVPAAEGTVVGDFSDILVDIGDEQSIQENLSTFSAHIKNIIAILQEAGPGKLVLIDELGAGTDPKEGAALGLAVLRRLHNSGALVVISTHYSEIKTLAYETPGMENACMEWDSVNTVPTYKLVVGRPGRSNGLDVALKIGLPPEIVREARDLMPRDLVRLEDMVREMEEKNREVEGELLKLREEVSRYERLRAEMETMVKTTEGERKEILAAARREAQEIVRRVTVETERLVKEIRKASHAPDREALIAKVREELDALRRSVGEEMPETAELGFTPIPPEEITPGTSVRVRGFTEPGRVLQTPGEDGTALVQVGSVAVRVKAGDLAALCGPGEKRFTEAESRHPRAKLSLPNVAASKAVQVRSEIDLRGVRASEALELLDKYLDDAYLAGLKTARIIHGKGTGALRKAVVDFLQNHPHVKEFRSGELAEGGHGVTVVALKE
ncbi:MAG TPA: endonuclease MutS2 [Firmicutes bacterium]|nr:endonuclease MutS2 [Candidatus Fermentithermobacillaceae bacterium]